jgi:hypothetical protein
VAGKKYADSAFTLFALTIVMVDLPLKTARLPLVMENLPMSCIYHGERYIPKVKKT